MRSKTNLTRRISKAPAGPIEGRLDSLIQGVSQQPEHLRVVGQGEEQLNGWSSPVEGLTKRNPLRLVGKIIPQPVTDFYLEMMSVIAGERYSVFTYPQAGTTKTLFTLNGTPAAVHVHGTGMSVASGLVTSGSNGYLFNTAGNYFKKYVLINAGPLGLLLNREKITGFSSATSPAAKNEALIFVQGVTYDVKYTVKLDGVAAGTYTTPKATDTNNQLSTSEVANQLATLVNAVAGYTATVEQFVVHVRRIDGASFRLEVDDSRATDLARAIQNDVVFVGQLPLVAPNGFVVKVEGDPGQTVDDRWVKFTTRGGSAFGEGSWAETLKPGLQYELDKDTMPLVIYRVDRGVLFVGPADGSTQTQTVGGKTYSYTFPKWGERTAGDEETVPNPDFIGQRIRDHTFFRGRYTVCSGQSVIFSETDQIFNFFQDTSVALTATDGFSVLGTSEASAEMNWLLPVDENILAFTDHSQFRVSAADADVLTPETAIILRLSNLEMNPHIRPRLAGPQILFGTNEFGYSHFREYSFFDTQQRRTGLNLGGTNDVCMNIPKYIKGLATHWDVGETIDCAACVTADDRKTLYVYKYLFQSASAGLSKSQSSWSKFTFGGDIQWLKFMDNEMWLVLTYPDGTYTAHITSDELELPSGVQPHLDRLILYPECNTDVQASNNVTATYDADTDVTTFTLPYAVSGTAHAVVRYTSPTKEGLLLGTATSGNQIVCGTRGDWRNASIAFGEEYLFRYAFSHPYAEMRDQARSRIVGKLDGRTQLLTFTTFHHNTGRYDIRIERKNRQLDSVHKFRSRYLNVASNRLDTETMPVETGSFKVPIYCQNTACRIFVESTSWLPVVITGAQWEGAYSNRSKGG